MDSVGITFLIVTIASLATIALVGVLLRNRQRRERIARAFISLGRADEASASARHSTNRTSGIFLSYRRDDEPHLAGRLNDRITAEFGRANVFIDVDSIDPGLDFTEEIVAALEKCQVMLVLIGDSWTGALDTFGRRRLEDPNDYVRFEVEAALARGIRVIPVLVEGVRMPSADELPTPIGSLARRNAVQISHIRFGADAGRIVEVLRRVVG